MFNLIFSSAYSVVRVEAGRSFVKSILVAVCGLLITPIIYCLLATTALSQTQRSPVGTPAVYKIDGMEKMKAKREGYKSVEGEQLSFDLYQPTDMAAGEKRGVVIFAN